MHENVLGNLVAEETLMCSCFTFKKLWPTLQLKDVYPCNPIQVHNKLCRIDLECFIDFEVEIIPAN